DAGATQAADGASALLIVKSPIPIPNGTDLDADDNGTPDPPSTVQIVDGIAIVPAGATAPKFVPKLDQPAAPAAAATRLVGGETKGPSVASGYGGGRKGGPDWKEYDPEKSTATTPKSAILTPGKINSEAGSGPPRQDAGTGTTSTEPPPPPPPPPAANGAAPA